MAPLKILISGAGIAGPAAAFWLARLGHSCTVIERHHELRTMGQQIDLRQQGVEAARRMGLLDEIWKHIVDEECTILVDSKGRQQAEFVKQSQGTGSQSFTSEFEIMRDEICKILYGVTEINTTYRFGVMVSEFKNEGNKVKITFSNGTIDTFDLLIVADGQSSRIRRQLVEYGKIQDESRSLNVFNAYFKLPRQPDDRNACISAHAPNQRAMMTRWHSPNEGSAYFMTMSHPEEMRSALKGIVSEQKELFASVFGDAGWQAPRLIEEMRKVDDFYAQELMQRKSDVWSVGRVVLLGDAGYCPSPLTGMGTSLALVGAYVLAGEISQHEEDIETALAEYERVLRPLVKEVQQLPPGMPGLLLPKSAFGVKALQSTAWMASVLKLEKLTGLFGSDDKKAWKLPDYARLNALH